MAKRKSNPLIKELLESGKQKDQYEFLRLVKNGTLGKNDYKKFVICKYCNNKIDGSCKLFPNETYKCSYVDMSKIN